MAQKRKSTKKRKSHAKKGKVYIAPYKIIMLCGFIIAFCMFLLLITTVISPAKTEKSVAQSQSISRRYTDEKKADSASPKPQTVKAAESAKSGENANPKTAEKKAEPVPVKTQPQKTVEKKTPVPEKQPQKIQPEVKKPVENNSVQKEKEQPAQKVQTKPVENVKTGFNFPQAVNGAQLIFVFDDGGHNTAQVERFMKLPFPITVAVLPKLAHSKDAAAIVRRSGNEVILHQPMQSVNPKVNPGLGAITPSMTEDEIISCLFQNITEVGPISGMNNHEGSAITADAEKMSVILKMAAEEGIYFLDSRTNVETKVPYVAREMGYSYYERNIFLDNEKTRENILKELQKGIDIANKNGFVIMIGHVWSADILPAVLEEVYPELKSKGYTFKTVSQSKGLKY